MKKKINYLLDTNVLMTSPYSINAFDEHDVSIADITLEELDHHKTDYGDTGANVRQAIRILDEYRRMGNLAEGVGMGNGKGTLRIEVNHLKTTIPETWDQNAPDNRILRVAKGMKEDGLNVILVSNDINMRLKADILGIPVEEYKTDRMVHIDEQYKGRTEISVSSEAVDSFYKDKELDPSVFGITDLCMNEFVTINDEFDRQHTALGRFDGSKIVALRYSKEHPSGVTPRNAGQTFIQEALMAPASEIPLVILKGQAGTAKTFYSLAVGLEKVLRSKDDAYRRILVARPNVKFDDDIGYLKGSEEDKITPLIRPIYDNLDILVGQDDHYEGEQIQSLFEDGIIVAQALAYMRGRSITDTWIIIDECQNMTPTQAFGIISRAGTGSKVILAGDPEQIDNPHLDSRSNGLTYASECMKGSPLCAQITFSTNECVRSPLAVEAIKRLSPKGMAK